MTYMVSGVVAPPKRSIILTAMGDARHHRGHRAHVRAVRPYQFASYAAHGTAS
jgi:hypothetical protein